MSSSSQHLIIPSTSVKFAMHSYMSSTLGNERIKLTMYKMRCKESIENSTERMELRVLRKAPRLPSNGAKYIVHVMGDFTIF